VLAARRAGDADAEVAIRVYLHRLRRQIGAVTASLGELDAVVLTGGVAEHQPDLIAEPVRGLPLLGLLVDTDHLRGKGDAAALHCVRGAGIFEWASNDGDGEPDVVLACAGDVPTVEILPRPRCCVSTCPRCGCGWSTWWT
jgi:hypothetical protein